MTSRRAFLKGLCGVAPLGVAAPAAVPSSPPGIAVGRDYETERVLDRLPAILIRWDARVKLTPEDVQRRFREGNPSIETRLVDGVFSVNTWCLDPEHVPIVRRRLGEVLRSGA